MHWGSEQKFLAQLLVRTGKSAITSEKYEDGDEVLDSAMYTISRLIRRVTTTARDIPWYGVGSQLTAGMKQRIDKSSIETDPEGQFSWCNDPAEAINLFVAALADPPSRMIIEGVLIAFKEQLDFNNEMNKSKSQRKADME